MVTVRSTVICSLFLLYLSTTASADDEMQELLTQLHNTCRDETGAGEDEIENAKKGNFMEDDKLKCYMMCVMEQMAVISEDGIVDEDALIGLMPDDLKTVLAPGIKHCGTKIGANPCDNAFQTFKCYHGYDPAHYFLP